MKKNVIGLLVLASAVQPFASQAAQQSATVTIRATVDATLALDVANTFDLQNKKGEQTLDIKTLSNGTKVKLEVFQAEAADDHIVLTNGKVNQKMNVKATLGSSMAKFEHGTLSIEVPSATTQQTTQLHLTAQPAAAQTAGEYSGTITVKAWTM
ncbi:Uncharacterised protein [Edwardsiella tarda]|nr:Uncharacterised protein [Edwardsiella tarda]